MKALIPRFPHIIGGSFEQRYPIRVCEESICYLFGYILGFISFKYFDFPPSNEHSYHIVATFCMIPMSTVWLVDTVGYKKEKSRPS